MEGVLKYLQPESMDETFKVIEGLAGEGSQVVFDYVLTPVLRQAGEVYCGTKPALCPAVKASSS